jgi:hypothetical protein
MRHASNATRDDRCYQLADGTVKGLDFTPVAWDSPEPA